MEFILVFAFSLAIILPVVHLLGGEYWNRKQELDQVQSKQILDEIALVVQDAYFAGYPTRTTMQLFFPDSVRGITTRHALTQFGDKTELIIELDRGGSAVVVFDFNVTTELRNTTGRRNILVKVEKTGNVNLTEGR